MEIARHRDVAGFSRLVRPMLDADPLRHTILLSVLDGMVREGDRADVLLTGHVDGGLAACALRSAGWKLLVSGVPARHSAVVASALADEDLPGASGPVPEAEAFAAAYASVTGAAVDVGMEMRLFDLGTLVPPRGVAGSARFAGAGDVDLVGAWRAAMAEEIGMGWHDPLGPSEVAARAQRLGRGEVLWELAGVPVSYASVGLPVAGMSRIGPVFTPPEQRGHGYAAAATAVGSQWALDAGAAHVLLFTDATNDVTNRLYPRLGYNRVLDAVDLSFRAADRQGPAKHF
jgi:GNAT superfamily N-acetyltransferase